jgi:tetratricopeptide (TPR) repeat protein
MALNEYAVELGRAWALHREGRNETAMDEFNQMLREAPDNIDALYGLGLAQRALHMYDKAKQTFDQCLVLVNRALEENPGEDRYEMLQRFIHQRLAEIETLTPS